MKRTVEICCLVVCCLSLPFIGRTPVVKGKANSAQSSWEGVTASGEIFVGGNDCPLRVIGENLTFDLQEFPYTYGDLSDYKGKVTAEYTFFNPADYTVKAKLLFPFGGYPEYGNRRHDEPVNDTNNYDITVNGSAIEKQLRHTWVDESGFVAENEIKKVQDDYATYHFLAPDLTVYKYVYDITANEEQIIESDSELISCTVGFDNTKTRFFCENLTDANKESEGCYRYRRFSVYKQQTLELYAIGEDFTVEPQFQLLGHQEGDTWNLFEIENSVVCRSKTETSFKDFLMQYREEDTVGSEIDWYNAVVFEIMDDNHVWDKTDGQFYDVWEIHSELNMSRILWIIDDALPMRWYSYEIEVAPQSTITNCVTAPIYPTINGGRYEYAYLLSPASTWTSFENLKIVINTPYALTKSSVGDFESVESGYTLFLKDLPKGELKFTLYDPQKTGKKNKKGCFSTIDGGAISIALISAVLLFKKKKY